jgi:hypothetical protein
VGGSARFTVMSADEAGAALDYFNGFHDGFIKRLTVTSHDVIAPDLSQVCTGLFDAELDLAHYNYGEAPFRPADQLVRATFRGVRDVTLDLRTGFIGNTIIRLVVLDGRRERLGASGAEACLVLRLGRNFYLRESDLWEFRESDVFSFTSATFEEMPGVPTTPASARDTTAGPAD